MYSITVRVVDSEQEPVEKADVMLDVDFTPDAIDILLIAPALGGGGRMLEETTDSDGEAVFDLHEAAIGGGEPEPSRIKVFVGSEEFGPYEPVENGTFTVTIDE